MTKFVIKLTQNLMQKKGIFSILLTQLIIAETMQKNILQHFLRLIVECGVRYRFTLEYD